MISLAAITGREDVQDALSLLAERVANHVLAEHCPYASARYHEEVESVARDALQSTLRSMVVEGFVEAVAEQMMCDGAALELDRSRGLL